MKLLKFDFNLLFYKKVFTIKNNVKNDNLIILIIIYFFIINENFFILSLIFSKIHS